MEPKAACFRQPDYPPSFAGPAILPRRIRRMNLSPCPKSQPASALSKTLFLGAQLSPILSIKIPVFTVKTAPDKPAFPFPSVIKINGQGFIGNLRPHIATLFILSSFGNRSRTFGFTVALASWPLSSITATQPESCFVALGLIGFKTLDSSRNRQNHLQQSTPVRW